MSIMRKLARERAKNKCHARGMRRICSRGDSKRGTSWFSKHWREYV